MAATVVDVVGEQAQAVLVLGTKKFAARQRRRRACEFEADRLKPYLRGAFMGLLPASALGWSNWRKARTV